MQQLAALVTTLGCLVRHAGDHAAPRINHLVAKLDLIVFSHRGIGPSLSARANLISRWLGRLRCPRRVNRQTQAENGNGQSENHIRPNLLPAQQAGSRRKV